KYFEQRSEHSMKRRGSIKRVVKKTAVSAAAPGRERAGDAITLDRKSNPSDLLEASLRVILSLPQSETRCKLLGRNAQAAARAGCREFGQSTARLAVSEARAIVRPFDRGLVEVEIANICVECDLSDLARKLLVDAEEVLKSLEPSPAVNLFALVLSDGIFQLGD